MSLCSCWRRDDTEYELSVYLAVLRSSHPVCCSGQNLSNALGRKEGGVSSLSSFLAAVQVLYSWVFEDESDVAENIKVDQPFNTSILRLAESLIRVGFLPVSPPASMSGF